MSLVSLYDEASLWMTPGAYEDGKLLSELPTDGSGDFTFSRGSNLAATRVNSLGLIEKGRENLLLQSNQFDTAWTTFSASVTSGQIGCDGSSDAWLLSKSGASGRLFQNLSASGVLTFSVYMKANASTWGLIQVDGSPNDAYVYVDLQNGTTGSTSSVNIVEGIEDVGNGWYRVSVSVNDVVTRLRIYPAETNSASATSGSIYIQDAQLEQGLVATDYIETEASTAQAGVLEDEPRLDYSGSASCPSLLLEPQRTNVVLNSEYHSGTTYGDNKVTTTDNKAISPEGVQNAAKIVLDNGANISNGGHYLSFSSTGGTTYTISIFAKAGEYRYFTFTYGSAAAGGGHFDLQEGTLLGTITNTNYSDINPSIEDYGNGWYRLVVSLTDKTSVGARYMSMKPSPSASVPSNNNYESTGDGVSGAYIYGFQLEVGSYPTSYIPTYGTSKTRLADDARNDQVITGARTYFIDGVRANNDFSSAGFFSSNTTEVRISFWTDNEIRIRIGASLYPTLIGDNFRIAISFDGVSSNKVFMNGVFIGETTFALTSTYENRITGTFEAWKNNQTIIFSTALTDSECIALTIDGLKEDIIASYKTRATTLESGAEDRLDTYLQELEDFIIV